MFFNAIVQEVTEVGIVVKDFGGNEIMVEWEKPAQFSVDEVVRIEYQVQKDGMNPPLKIKASSIIVTRSNKFNDFGQAKVNAASIRPSCAVPKGESIKRVTGQSVESNEALTDDDLNAVENEEETQRNAVYDDMILQESKDKIDDLDEELEATAEVNRRHSNRHDNRHNNRHNNRHDNRHNNRPSVIPVRPPIVPCPNCVPNRPSVMPVRMSVIVLARQRGSLLTRSLEGGRTVVVRTPHVMHFCQGQRLRITYDMMTMSNPPIVNALDIEAIC